MINLSIIASIISALSLGVMAIYAVKCHSNSEKMLQTLHLRELDSRDLVPPILHNKDMEDRINASELTFKARLLRIEDQMQSLLEQKDVDIGRLYQEGLDQKSRLRKMEETQNLMIDALKSMVFPKENDLT